MFQVACIDLVPVTPEYVLAVFRDQHRQVSRFDHCCDAEIDLTLDSTIEDWRDAMDLLPARQLGRAMNESWDIRVSDRDWDAVLSPPRRKTLCGVAELIARHATRPRLNPLSIAGTKCLPAAAFLAIKDCLALAGADVSNLAPSTPLNEFSRKHLSTFLEDVTRIAPGAIPNVDVDAPEDVAALSLGCASAAFWIAGLIAKILESNASYLMVIGGFLQLLLWVGSKSRHESRIRSVQFGELQTFRELAKCVARGAA